MEASDTDDADKGKRGRARGSDPGGEGACRSMASALEVAHLSPEDVDYINLHGTGTPAGDPVESRAIYTIEVDFNLA